MASPTHGQSVDHSRRRIRSFMPRQPESAPGCATRNQGRDDDGQERELERLGILRSPCRSGERRQKGNDEDDECGHQAPAAPGRGKLAGPPVGSPAAHRVGRRWKKPQSSTTTRVPIGMANVNAWVLATSENRTIRSLSRL